MNVKKIDGGASGVLKYLIETDLNNFVLRIHNSDFFASRIKAIECVKKASEVISSFPKIYKYGEIKGTNKSFVLLDYIDGTSLDILLKQNPELTSKYAKLVACELKKLHDLTRTNGDKSEYMLSKVTKRYEKIKEKTPDVETIYAYVKENYLSLKNRPVCIVHGDFYPGNIIIDNDKVKFIDIDMCDYNDPYTDLSVACTDSRYYDFYRELYYEYFKDSKVTAEDLKAFNVYSCYYILDYVIYAQRNNIDANSVVREFLNTNQDLILNKPTWLEKRK